SRPPQTRTKGMAACRVEAVRNRTRGQVLFPDPARTKTARAGERKLDAAFGSGSSHLRRGRHDMKQLLNWFRRNKLEIGLDRELQYRLERRVSALILSGVPEQEARRRTLVELGITQVREEVRDVWLSRWLRDFVYDLRFSVRSFLRSPSFTVTTVLSLALG